jgi:TonB family protein
MGSAPFQRIAAFALAAASVLNAPAFAQQPLQLPQASQPPAQSQAAQPPQTQNPQVPVPMQPQQQPGSPPQPQHPPSAEQPPQPPDISALAAQLADQIKKGYPAPATIAVLSFRGPRSSDAPFGAWIADKFSEMLVKAMPGYRMTDRVAVAEVENKNPSWYYDEFDVKRVVKIGKKLKANIIVAGSMPTLEPSVSFSIEAYSLDGNVRLAIISGPASLAKLVDPIAFPRDSGFSPDLAPPGGVPYAGKNGVSEVRCIYCPSPRFKNGMKVPHHFLGYALIGVFVGVDGSVTSPSLVRSCGIQDLDQEALKVVKTWTFIPAHKPDGTVISAFVDVEVQFIILN